MIIEYIIEPISVVAFENVSGIPEKMRIDGAQICFDIDERQNLKTMNVTISGLPMKWERTDLIDPNYPETRDQAFRIIKYLVDRIQLQVKNKTFDLSRFNDVKTQVFPETEEEKENWNKFRKRIMVSLEMPYSNLGAADTSDYESKYKNVQAFSNFTDALNADNPITKYVQFIRLSKHFLLQKEVI